MAIRIGPDETAKVQLFGAVRFREFGFLIVTDQLCSIEDRFQLEWEGKF